MGPLSFIVSKAFNGTASFASALARAVVAARTVVGTRSLVQVALLLL